MYSIVNYKGVPEIWHPKDAWQLTHLGSNYSVTGIEFKTLAEAEEYLNNQK